MRTACLLRRTWSRLHSTYPRIGFNDVRTRSPRTFLSSRHRVFSASSGLCSVSPELGSPFQNAPKLRSTWWSPSSNGTVSRGGSAKFRAAGLKRVAGLGSLNTDFEDSEIAWPRTSLTSSNSRCFNTHPKARLGDELAIENVKFSCEEIPTPNICSPFHGAEDESEELNSWDEIQTVRRNNGSADFLALSGSAGLALRRRRLGSIVTPSHFRSYSTWGATPPNPESHLEAEEAAVKPLDYSQRAVVTALWCNFLVFSLKLGVWIMTSSHVMLAEAIHSLADLANQGLIAYGLMSSRRAPDALHPYGYSKERFVWSLISAVGIFCLGSGATIIHGVQNLWHAQPLENAYLAALVIGGSMIMEGASLLVAISCVRNGAKAEGMTVRDYLWRGHDPTSVAVMMEDGAAVTGLAIAGVALTAVHYTGNPIWDPVGSIVVGNLLGAVAIFLIQRNRHALLGRSMDEHDMRRVLDMLGKDPVVDAIYDCKSEVIGPGAYRFKAEIDFNGVTIVQNYIRRAGRGNWQKEFQDAVSSPEPGHLDRVMAAYGEEVVSALGSEVDRLEREIQKVVPGIRHVDIEAHNPNGPAPRERLYLPMRTKDNLIAT